MGKGPALVVFLLDVLKGSAAVLLRQRPCSSRPDQRQHRATTWVVAAGLGPWPAHLADLAGVQGSAKAWPPAWACCSLVPAVGPGLLRLFLGTLTVSRSSRSRAWCRPEPAACLYAGSFMTAGTACGGLSGPGRGLTPWWVVWRHRATQGA